jgi:hypothetical protein
MDNAPPINVPTNGKYPLGTSPVPPGVSIEGDMLGRLSSLKFMDHDITDEKKFPELAREKYLCTKSIPGTGEIVLETQVWETGLEKVRHTEPVGDPTLQTQSGN